MTKLLFTASWCSPCNAMKANLTEEDLASTRIIDIDQEEDLVIQYNIKSVPTTIIVDENDNEIKRVTGSMSRSDFAAL